MKPRYIKRIRDQRQDHDLTQKQIAVVLQTTRQVYSRAFLSRQHRLPFRRKR